MIYILTGDIRTGKTSALLNWIINREDVDGLICPDGKDRKRYFLKVKSKEEFELEVAFENNIESDKIINIGPFHFLKSAFKKANDFLISFTSENDNQYLIIDELGKLELNNEGLHFSAETLIPQFLNDEKQHLILVVRTTLLEEVVNHYHIKAYTLLTKEDLETIV
ncbi:nucleoside-triphosphatase [Psychroserpens sp. AS72]|uniref:nucleoside-triphosphatase n=1 Tax=Psychroserpens sp. AS72 TaxID=3135775 RepID=UPI003173D7CE